MKLFYKILMQLSIILSVLMAGWAVYFYYNILYEVNDETDDALENYSEMIVTRYLAGDPLPSESSGTNNSYFIQEATEEYMKTHSSIEYKDEMMYIEELNETEPARTMQLVFKDRTGRNMLLTVSTPTIDKEDLKEAIFYWIVFLYVILLLIVLLVNVVVYQNSMKPLYVLLRWLDSYKVGTTNKALDNETNIREFQQLNEAVVRYVERSEKVFEQQKQFIGNASHEIQTPLAACQNRLEMLAESSPLTEGQLGEIIKTQQTIEYISRLNKSLLFLSKIENGQFPESQDVSMTQMIKRILDDFVEIFDNKGIHVDLEEGSQLVVYMNKTLAYTLVSNLLKNAYVHNRNQGQIKISISDRALAIGNTGDETPLDGGRIFERFYQGRKKEGSTGLGLSIVAAICHIYKIKIRYEMRDGLHYFFLRF